MLRRFLNNLLSDSHAVSLKRFIGLVAFTALLAVIVVALIKKITPDNVILLNSISDGLVKIVLISVLSVAATDIFFKKSD